MANIIHIEGNLLQIIGATKVVSSTSTQAVVELGEKCVVLQGEKIEVKKLNLEAGEVCLEGEFSNIKFSNVTAKKGGFFKRIFK